MVSAPLVRGFGANATFAYSQGHRISVEQFLRDVSCLSASLPDRQYLLNLCADRYRFTVGFAAALLRGQVNVLPPNETPDMIGRVVSRYPDVYCLSDHDGTPGASSLETLCFPERLYGGAPPPHGPARAGTPGGGLAFSSRATRAARP